MDRKPCFSTLMSYTERLWKYSTAEGFKGTLTCKTLKDVQRDTRTQMQ